MVSFYDFFNDGFFDFRNGRYYSCYFLLLCAVFFALVFVEFVVILLLLLFFISFLLLLDLDLDFDFDLSFELLCEFYTIFYLY